LLPENDFYAVKAPVFSTNKLAGVDPNLVPEMKSTGEVIALSHHYEASLRKAFLWNESLDESQQKENKQLLTFVDETERDEIKEQCSSLSIDVQDGTVFSSFDEIEKWMKEHKAYAIYQPEGNGNRNIRERALEF